MPKYILYVVIFCLGLAIGIIGRGGLFSADWEWIEISYDPGNPVLSQENEGWTGLLVWPDIGNQKFNRLDCALVPRSNEHGSDPAMEAAAEMSEQCNSLEDWRCGPGVNPFALSEAVALARMREAARAGDWQSYDRIRSDLFFARIPVPCIQFTREKAKFLDLKAPSDGDAEADLVLGYLVQVSAKKLGPDAPTAHESIFGTRSNAFYDIEPKANANLYYYIDFTFTLKNDDGFVLSTITSQLHTLKPGETNLFQQYTEETIPRKLALQVSEISMHMTSHGYGRSE